MAIAMLLTPLPALAFNWTAEPDTGGHGSGFGPSLHGGGTIDNKIYIAGGGFLGSSLWASDQAAQVYDPLPGSWTNIASMTGRRTAPASAVARFAGQSRLYIIGGTDLSGFPDHFTHPDIEEYDPVAGSWRTVASCSGADDCLPDGSYTWGACAATIDNRIYIMGGANSGFLMTDRLASYDPDTDSFQSLAPMPAQSSDGSCAAVGRKIYYFSGYRGVPGWGSSPSSTTLIYDVDLGSWSTAASSVPTPRANAGAIAIGGRVYLVAGWDGSGTYAGFYNSVDEYDPVLDSWTGNLASPIGCIEDSVAEGVRGRAGLTLHLADDGSGDRIYAVGGGIGISIPTRCHESAALAIDVDPPVFAGLQSAAEGTVCPDPAAPTVQLGWSAASDSTLPVTYNVYRGGSPVFTPDLSSRIASGVGGTTYEDTLTGTDCFSTFFYLVRAQDSAVPANEDSNNVLRAVDLTCPAPAPPSSVGNNLLLDKDGSDNPALDWSGYTPSAGVTHYHLHRSTLATALGGILFEPTTTSQTDMFASGPMYFYDVRSATDCGHDESAD